MMAAPESLSPAQKAWATRRARDAARADIKTLAAGVKTPSPVYVPEKPVVDLWLDDVRVGCGQRRYVVLEVGTKWVVLFYPAQLVSIRIDRLTFDKHAKPAMDSKKKTLRRIIRDNIARAERINRDAGRQVMPEGGKRAAQALAVLR